MLLTRLCLKHPVAVAIFYSALLIAGLVAYARLGRSVLPPIAFPIVEVTVGYPGASAMEMERLVVAPLEDELQRLPGVERVSSSSMRESARISVRFRFGSDRNSDHAAVQQAVDAARVTLPPDLGAPLVRDVDSARGAVLEEALSSAIVPLDRVAAIVREDVEPALHAAPGVRDVQARGVPQRQLVVRPLERALSALGGTDLDVFAAVSRASQLSAGGVVRSSVREATVGITSLAASPADVERLPVSLPSGSTVRLKDVARLAFEDRDPALLVRVDGEPAVVLSVSPADNASTAQAIRSARAAFRRLARRFPLLRFEELRTDEPSTDAAVEGVLQTLAEGVALTVLVMLLFLRAWRDAAVAAIAIPASLCAALVGMWACGFTLNVLSLMGLSLTIGILVDDAIVILEAIRRAVQRGLHGDDAALAGRAELGGAAFAITLVDVAVFIPLAVMNGLIGAFMREFALVVIFATVFSLIVALTLAPLLSARWALRGTQTSCASGSFAAHLTRLRARARTLPWTLRSTAVLSVAALVQCALYACERAEERLTSVYAERLLPAALRRSGMVMSAAFVLCVAAIVPAVMGWLPTEFSPPALRGTVALSVRLPPGSPIGTMERAMRRVSDVLLEDPRVEHVEADAGVGQSGPSQLIAGDAGTLRIVLADQSSSGDDVRDLARSLAARAGMVAAGEGRGMGGAARISYSLSGAQPDLSIGALRLATALARDPAASDVQSSDGGLRPHLDLRVDHDRAALLGIASDAVVQTARIATGGALALRGRDESGPIDVIVRSGSPDETSLRNLDRVAVRSASGALVPLTSVLNERWSQTPAAVERENGKRVVTIGANTVGDAPIGPVIARLRAQLASLLPGGVHVEPRGDVEQFRDTAVRILFALALAVGGVYGVLAVLYRSYGLPLVVMLTVPLAAIGSLGLLVLVSVLNLYSMLGIVMLVGLVAKNGILLVDFAERSLREGRDAQHAIVEAARRRFRPIIMTTFAMIAGMTPLALGSTVGAQYRKALGIAVIGGLSSSLLLTFFAVPVAYVAYRRYCS